MADKKTSASRTSTLLRRLMRTSDLPAFIKKHEQEMDVQPFHEYISEICLRKELVPEQVKLAVILHIKLLFEDYEPKDKERMEKARDDLLVIGRLWPV